MSIFIPNTENLLILNKGNLSLPLPTGTWESTLTFTLPSEFNYELGDPYVKNNNITYIIEARIYFSSLFIKGAQSFEEKCIFISIPIQDNITLDNKEINVVLSNSLFNQSHFDTHHYESGQPSPITTWYEKYYNPQNQSLNNVITKYIDFLPNIWFQLTYKKYDIDEEIFKEEDSNYVLIPTTLTNGSFSEKYFLNSWTTDYYSSLNYDKPFIFLEDLKIEKMTSNKENLFYIFFYKKDKNDNNSLDYTYKITFPTTTINDNEINLPILFTNLNNEIDSKYIINFSDYKISFGFKESIGIDNYTEYMTPLYDYYPSAIKANECKIVQYDLIKDFNGIYMSLSTLGKNYFFEYNNLASPFARVKTSDNDDLASWLTKFTYKNMEFSAAPLGRYKKIRYYFQDESGLVEGAEFPPENSNYTLLESSDFNNNIRYEYSFSYFCNYGNYALILRETTESIRNIVENQLENKNFLFISNDGIAIGQNYLSDINQFEINNKLTTIINGPLIANGEVSFPFCYKPGTYSLEVVTSGYITSSSKKIVFDIVLPKFLNNIKNINISSFVGSIRTVKGQYVLFNTESTKRNWLTNGYTATCSKKGDNRLRIRFYHTSTHGGWEDIGNNEPDTNGYYKIRSSSTNSTFNDNTSQEVVTNNSPLSIIGTFIFNFS